MRDPKRINEIMDKLKKRWEKVPDMRFYQFLIALTYEVYNDNPDIHDMFYLEDDRFIKTLDRLLAEDDKFHDC